MATDDDDNDNDKHPCSPGAIILEEQKPGHFALIVHSHERDGYKRAELCLTMDEVMSLAGMFERFLRRRMEFEVGNHGDS